MKQRLREGGTAQKKKRGGGKLGQKGRRGGGPLKINEYEWEGKRKFPGCFGKKVKK